MWVLSVVLSIGFSPSTHTDSKQRIAQGDADSLSTMYVNSHAEFFFPLLQIGIYPATETIFNS